MFRVPRTDPSSGMVAPGLEQSRTLRSLSVASCFAITGTQSDLHLAGQRCGQLGAQSFALLSCRIKKSCTRKVIQAILPVISFTKDRDPAKNQESELVCNMRKSFPPRRNQAKFEQIVKEFSERAGVDFRAKIEPLPVERSFSEKPSAASGLENGDDQAFGPKPKTEHGKYNQFATL